MKEYFSPQTYDEIRKRVSPEDAARYYGFEPNRAGYICCPFHRERTPSLKLYPDGFHCYGCGAGGSVIDFVAKLFGLDAQGACRQLNRDFRLGLPLARPPTERERQEAEAREHVQEARKLFTEWRERMLRMMNAAIRTANTADYNRLSEAEMTAIRWRETLEDWEDTLACGTLEEQMQIFRDREDIERLCRIILKNTKSTQTKSRVA
jgi:DNA primase